MANNPVLSKLEGPPAGSAPTQTSPPSPQDLERMYNQPAAPTPSYPGASGPPPSPPGAGQPASPFAPQFGSRYMTLDDVVVRTAAMLAVIMAFGVLSWSLASSSVSGVLIIVGVFGGLGLGLYMSITAKASAVTALAYAAFEGLFLGAISRAFEERFSGIVVQAITGTVMVAAGMLFIYKIGAIRVTPRLWRVGLPGALIGVLGLMLGFYTIVSLFHPGGLGVRGSGPMALIFSLVCIGVASLSLVLDFDLIERSDHRVAPRTRSSPGTARSG